MTKKINAQRFAWKRIVIIGLGLMGGSLAAACRKLFPKAVIVGVTRNPAALRHAQKKNWIHQGCRHFLEGVRDADLIVLCTPVNTFAKMLALIDGRVKPGTLVTDIGSVKGQIIRWAESKKWKNLKFVGAHPMVGSHEQGIYAADPKLYECGFTYVIRTPKTDAESFRKVHSFWSAVSPRVAVMSAVEHDRIAAEISHLPHALAAVLMQTVSPDAIPFAGKGFFDTTRVAQGHPSIWLPIFLNNRDELTRVLGRFKKKLAEFEALLKQNNPRKLSTFLDKAQAKRLKIGSSGAR